MLFLLPLLRVPNSFILFPSIQIFTLCHPVAWLGVYIWSTCPLSCASSYNNGVLKRAISKQYPCFNRFINPLGSFKKSIWKCLILWSRLAVRYSAIYAQLTGLASPSFILIQSFCIWFLISITSASVKSPAKL